MSCSSFLLLFYLLIIKLNTDNAKTPKEKNLVQWIDQHKKLTSNFLFLIKKISHPTQKSRSIKSQIRIKHMPKLLLLFHYLSATNFTAKFLQYTVSTWIDEWIEKWVRNNKFLVWNSHSFPQNHPNNTTHLHNFCLILILFCVPNLMTHKINLTSGVRHIHTENCLV